jgi:hypothetical protein
VSLLPIHSGGIYQAVWRVKMAGPGYSDPNAEREHTSSSSVEGLNAFPDEWKLAAQVCRSVVKPAPQIYSRNNSNECLNTPNGAACPPTVTKHRGNLLQGRSRKGARLVRPSLLVGRRSKCLLETAWCVYLYLRYLHNISLVRVD